MHPYSAALDVAHFELALKWHNLCDNVRARSPGVPLRWDIVRILEQEC